jgi:hypothetical protein
MGKLLSNQMQRIILSLYDDYSENGMTTNKGKEIYKCSNSFYKAMKYLENGGIIIRQKKEKTNRNLYFLSDIGIILGNILSKLPDFSDEVSF